MTIADEAVRGGLVLIEIVPVTVNGYRAGAVPDGRVTERVVVLIPVMESVETPLPQE